MMNKLSTLGFILLLALMAACAPKQEQAAMEQPVAEPSMETTENAPPILYADPDAESLEPELTADLESVDTEQPLTPAEEQALESEPEIQFHLTVTENKDFERYFRYFTAKDKYGNSTRGRKAFERWLKRSEPFLPYVRKVFRDRGLPEDLVFLPFAESGYNAWAYSRAGAAGMWQFMSFTGRKYGLKVDWWIDERRDPYKATHSAADYLTVLHGLFDDWYLALAAYNAGEGRIARAMRKSGCDNFFDLAKNRYLLHRETRHYVPKFLAIIKIVKNLESLGFEPLDWGRDPNLVDLEVKGGTDLLALAQASGMSWKEFHHLNPAFRHQVSPPDFQATIYIPQEKLASAEEYLASPDSRPYAGYHRYRVRSGDSWWRISRRYGVPITVMKKLNSHYSNLLRPGQYLLIPGKGSSHNVAAASTSRAKRRAYALKRANYTVQRGDTLWSISQTYNVSLNTLRKANGLNSGRYLKVGQKLYIPDAGKAKARIAQEEAQQANKLISYRVRRGDSVWSIARRFGVSVQRVMAWNNLSNSSIIRPGDRIKVYVP